VTVPSLQDGIDRAGSAVGLLWKPGSPPWMPEVVQPEYDGWQREQVAWHESVALSDLSHHMSDTFFEGPDATRLLDEVSANNYRDFAIGQAKQFIAVSYDGNLVMDGILMRTGEETYTLSGVSAAQNWVKYHAERGGYDVSYETDPESSFRGGADPRLFRFQIQGPAALQVYESAFGQAAPEVRFFHSADVDWQGRRFRALRHGMAGQAGFELIGSWADAAAVKDALQAAGEPLGMARVGAMAYPTASLESGWIPTVVPAIYTQPELDEYRKSIGLFSFEGQKPLHGSFYSPDVRDYYVSPFELGYGRSVSFDHDFIGKAPLAVAKDRVRRVKVTLALDPGDVRAVVTGDASDESFVLSYARYAVESDHGVSGMTYYAGTVAPAGKVLALAVVDRAAATPGTEVSVVWGEHPGGEARPDVYHAFPRLRATVHVAPYDGYARTAYRGAAPAS